MLLYWRKYREADSSNKKELCDYAEQFPVAFLQDVSSQFLILGRCIGGTLGEKNRWNNLVSANIKKTKGAKRENWRGSISNAVRA
jgi:hypothetical protein